MKTNRRLLSAILAIVMILTMLPVSLVASAEDETVLEIASADELLQFAKDFNDGKLSSTITTVQLTKDISLSGRTWTIVGTEDDPFDLVFDGNGHVISDLTMSGTKDTELGGIFAYVSGTVQNLAIVDSSFDFTARVGSIAANVTKTGTIKGCAVYNTDLKINIDSDSLHIARAGGLVGHLDGGVVTDCYSKADIYISDPYGVNYAGGLVADATDNSTISNSYYAGNMASVNGIYNIAGGIVGYIQTATVENCYVAGLVTGEVSGAIAGWASIDEDEPTTNTTFTNNYYFAESNLYEYQYSSKENYTGVAGEAVSAAADITAAKLGTDAYEDVASLDPARTDAYPFPVLKSNSFDDVDDSPAENTTVFAGGRGTLWAPYQIETETQLKAVNSYLNSAFVLNNNITFTKGEVFTSSLIGTSSKPFVGSFDGANNSILGLVINSTSEKTAMFASNFGIIKNFTLDEIPAVAEVVDNTDPENPIVTTKGEAAVPSSITAVSTGTNSYAAAIAVENYGKISYVTSKADVFLDSNKLNASAAGIVAVNYGVVEKCTNNANILIDNTGVIDDTDVNYKNVFEMANINVAGLVAINNLGGKVSGSSSDTARSVITSVDGSNKISQAQFVAKNNGLDADVSGTDITDATAKVATFRFEFKDTVLTHGDAKFAKDTYDLTSELLAEHATATVVAADGTSTDVTAEMKITYTNLTNNYQKITLTHDDYDYMVVFFRWIDYTNIKVDASGAKTSFFMGDNFNANGLEVTGVTADGVTESLDEVDSADANGYQVKVFDGTREVTDLSTEIISGSEKTYTAKVYYYGNAVTNGEYTIHVYGIKELVVDLKGTETYLGGATPEFRVKAKYGDPDETVKTLGKKYYSYIVAGDVNASEIASLGYVAADADDDSLATCPTTAGTYYIYVKYTDESGDKYGISDPITVISSSDKVSNLSAEVGSASNKIECDNVVLTWKYANAGKDGVTFKVQRKENIDLSKLNEDQILELAGALSWKTLASDVTDTTYTDTKSEGGSEYQYRVVIVVSDVSCDEDSATTVEDVAPATPSNCTLVAPQEGDKDYYYVLGEELGHKGVSVVANYANGTSEEIKYSDTAEIKDLLKFYFDEDSVDDFDSSTPGVYTITVKRCTKASVLSILTKYETVGTFKVEVLAPTCISKATAKYDIYPTGYTDAEFRNTLTVKVKYLNPTNTEETIKTRSLDSDSISSTSTLLITGDDFSTAGAKTAVLKHHVGSNTTAGVEVTYNVVDYVTPTNVKAEAQADGTVDLTWDEIPGAVKYNIYRSTSANGEYELVAYRTNSAELTQDACGTISGTDDSDTIEAGTTYYYKVAGVIADKEGAKSAASEGVTTAVPAYYVIDATDAKNAFAIGDKFTTRGIDVDAYYKIGDEYERKGLKTSQFTATCDDLDDDGKIKSAGVKSVTVTINNQASGTKIYTSTDLKTEFTGYTVTAYDLAAIQATVKKDCYPLNYDFTKSDIRLKAIYGENIGVEGKEIIAKRKTISSDNEDYVITAAPDMSKVGTHEVTVSYGGKEATVEVNVYNPNAVLSVETKANNDVSISLTINTNKIKFVKYYIFTRSSSYDMDEDVETVKVAPGDENTNVEEQFFEYVDRNVSKNTHYYYTVTPVYLDGAEGAVSSVIDVKTVAEKVAITPADNVGVTRSDSTLTVSAPKEGLKLETLLGTDIVNDAKCMVVFKSDGKTEYTGTLIATGCVIKLYASDDTDHTEAPKDQVTVVVKGDVSGDGKITALDAKKTLDVAGNVEGVSLTGAYALAANVDGKTGIKALDAKKILDFAAKVITTF